MPFTKNEKQTARLAFLADRMARLMADVVQMQAEYGPICFDEFYTDEYAEKIRKSKEYRTCLDFVRSMIKKHDKEQSDERDAKPDPVAGDSDTRE